MQSFKLESRWVFERDQDGAGEEVFNRTHIPVQASGTIQVHPSFRNLGVGGGGGERAAKLGPPTLTGILHSMLGLHTPASAG